MVWIPKFYHAGWALTVGGFWMDKYQCSQPNATGDNDIPDVADNADPAAIPGISQAGVPPWTVINLYRAMKACTNRGVGFHLCTGHEWAVAAEWSRLNGTMPHGNNRNTNPPADATYTTEVGVIDRAAIARGATNYRSLCGSGPNTWAHNHRADGIFDLNGNVWEWNMGLMMAQTTGYPWILASLNTDHKAAPYGVSTSVASVHLLDSTKGWTTNEFATMSLMDSAGTFFTINSNTGTDLTLASGTPAAGPYVIMRSVATNITSGSTSGQKIVTMQASADLKAFAIPASTDGTGVATYGNDVYYYDIGALRATVRGGDWSNGAAAGVFALHLYFAPSGAYVPLGFRACRSV
jgi:hypothetical protein